jgi:hypothetical protein
MRQWTLQTKLVAGFILLAGGVSAGYPIAVAAQQNQGGLLGRPSPPQPQQKQGVEYFLGSWDVTWTGRESPITAGPRTGVATFSRQGDGNAFQMRTEGTVDGGGSFRESGTFDWNPEKKVLSIREQVAEGVTLTGSGDWSSPIAIRYESDPVQVKGQTLKLRRQYSIISGSSFMVLEEISTNGGPFQRLGNGEFRKK